MGRFIGSMQRFSGGYPHVNMGFCVCQLEVSGCGFYAFEGVCLVDVLPAASAAATTTAVHGHLSAVYNSCDNCNTTLRL